MKKYILFLVFAIAFPFFAISQGCLPNGINFNTQAQIDSFPINHPDCTEIEGIVSINGDDIINLDSLYPIVSITSRLIIIYCPNINSISGLSNLISLDTLMIAFTSKLKTLNGLEGISNMTYLSIKYNDSLSNLNGLDNLTKVFYDFQLSRNNNLTDISALNNIYTLNHIYIGYNPRLKSLNGLQNVLYSDMGIDIGDNDSLTDVNFDDLTYSRYLYLYRNNELRNISFPNLLEINGDLVFQDNPLIVDLGDFSNLQSAEYLIVKRNNRLINIDGLNHELNISKSIYIKENDELQNIVGLNGATEVSYLNIIDNPNLQSINGFDNMASAENDIEISNNEKLEEIIGFSSLTNIGGSFIMEGNDILSSVNGFSNLENIGIHFTLKACNELTHIPAINKLEKIGHNLHIANNDNLLDFIGFESLEEVGDGFDISNNSSLINMNGFNSLNLIKGKMMLKNNAFVSLEGLEHLERVEFSITVKDCHNLETLIGLNNLSFIQRSFTVDNCDELINFSGLEKLTNPGGHLFIMNNSKLKNFEGLGNVRTVSYLFYIVRNPSLVNFSGLNSLNEMGEVYINTNNNLQNLKGLESLVTVNNGFVISDNSSIKNLKGIERVNSIYKELRFSSNDSLTSLDGLDNASLPQDISIYSNPFLSICNTKSICNFLNENPDAEVRIENNATGCNDVEEVFNACETSGVFDPIVFPDGSYMPSWNILELSTELPNIAQTHSYYMEADTLFCGQNYSPVYLFDLEQTLYVRSTHNKTYYRSNKNCDDKEYLLYNYDLEVGDTTWVGWEQYSQLDKDTVALVLNSIDTIHQFGINRRRYHMISAEGDHIYKGSLNWVEGMGSEIHPFYPFAKLNTDLLYDYSLLCYDSSGVQLYQNPLWNTCDTNYTAVDEIDLKNTISISPNPFNSQLKIVSTIGKIQEVKIYSITGELMQEITSQNKHSVFLNTRQEFPQGIYIIQVFTIDKMIQRKIMRF